MNRLVLNKRKVIRLEIDRSTYSYNVYLRFPFLGVFFFFFLKIINKKKKLNKKKIKRNFKKK